MASRMPRKYVFPSSDYPYHISGRCINREPFRVPLPEVWSLMEDSFYVVVHHYKVRIHSFVLMSNHFHLLATAPEGNMGDAMNYFMRETSKELNRLTGRINQNYGDRNHKTLINSTHYFMNVYKYVYQNPVRAGICERVEEYRFSTLHRKLGFAQLFISTAPDTILFNSEIDWEVLEWLNARPKPYHEDEIRQALRKPIFKLRAGPEKIPSELETLLL